MNIEPGRLIIVIMDICVLVNPDAALKKMPNTRFTEVFSHDFSNHPNLFDI